MSGNRLSVYDAAATMGVTVDAIRKRIARDTIPHERDENGRVWVILDTVDKVPDTGQDTDQYLERDALISAKDEIIAELQDRIRALEEANRENRRLLAAALERIPAIEAPQEPPGGPETADSPGPIRTPAEGTAEPYAVTETPFTQEEAEPRSSTPWWRRFFGR